MQPHKSSCTIRARYGLLVALATLIGVSGCYQWVPIEPGFAHGRSERLREVRLGSESGEALRQAQVTWPMLVTVREGQPVALDLRQTSVVRRKLTRGGVAAIVIPCVIGGLAVTMATALVILAPFAASIAGG